MPARGYCKNSESNGLESFLTVLHSHINLDYLISLQSELHSKQILDKQPAARHMGNGSCFVFIALSSWLYNYITVSKLDVDSESHVSFQAFPGIYPAHEEAECDCVATRKTFS